MKARHRTVNLQSLANRLVPVPDHGSFPVGFTGIVPAPAARGGVSVRGLEFGILRPRSTVAYQELTTQETVLVLLGGSAVVSVGGETREVSRKSLFDEGPSTIHCGAGTMLTIHGKRAEFALIRATNRRKLPVRFYAPEETATEDRGAGLVQGACRRLVRTIFDYSTRPDSALVVGEVVNFPGRWSSYPGHHHPQPEIYHYRFTLPQGYGHAEIGETVCKVRHGDTTVIPGGLDHAQVSAPGYGMYYLWVVRHLPRRPYRGFTFTREHTWLLDPKNQGWQPSP